MPLVRVLVNAVRLLTWPFWALPRLLRRRRTRWVMLRLKGRIVMMETPRAAFLHGLLRGLRPPPTSVSEVRKLRRRMSEDPHVQGLLVYVGHVEGGWATLSALREELARIRALGKRVVAYVPMGASQREIFLASAADRVLASPTASFSALGPMVARVYLAALLRKLGLSVEVLAEGPYKTAAEPLVRESMSDPEREQLTAIVGTLSEAWVERVSERPKLGEGGARKLLDTAYFGAAQARELGLLDDCHYEDQLPDALELPAKSRPREAAAYLRAAPRPLFLPVTRKPCIAVLRLEGVIAEEPSRGTGIGLGSTVSCLRAVADDPHILGVILYIDSPGGSAVVSDLLHREVKLLDAKKPVVAWMGNVAASGGYYLAAGTRHIVAAPTTLTGSIGVISARPSAPALFERLAVRQEIVKLAPHADIHSLSRELATDERDLLKAETRRFYGRFLEVVAEGRKRSRDEIEQLAGGRVWSGRDAHTHGLVDTLGGFNEARAALERELGDQARVLAREAVVVTPPRREVTPLPPARAALASLGLEAAGESALALWELCRTEHVLAYALDTSDFTDR